MLRADERENKIHDLCFVTSILFRDKKNQEIRKSVTRGNNK